MSDDEGIMYAALVHCILGFVSDIENRVHGKYFYSVQVGGAALRPRQISDPITCDTAAQIFVAERQPRHSGPALVACLFVHMNSLLLRSGLVLTCVLRLRKLGSATQV